MKKLSYLFVLLMTSTFFISCQQTQELKEPDTVGKYAFDLLKKIPDISKQAYMDRLLTIEQLRDFAKNDSEISEKTKNRMTKVSKEDFNAGMERNYNKIKKKAIEYGIVWNAIEYMDYTYKTEERNGIKGITGDMYFKYKNETYTIEVNAMNLTNEFAIVEIESLRKVEKRDY